MILSVAILIATLALTQSNDEFEFENNSPFQNLMERDFRLFKAWINCEERATILFYYKTVPDTGYLARSSTFRTDPLFPRECQQFNGNAYSSNYDRGHLVPANHLDHDAIAIRESNYMTNILPQTDKLNRGAWLHSEEITECLRDESQLEVIGGIVMGDDTDNDLFLSSHGVRTPDWFWKIIRNLDNGDIIAWLMPNDFSALRSQVDNYLTSVHDIEQKSGFYFKTIDDSQRYIVQPTSWEIPKGCDKS